MFANVFYTHAFRSTSSNRLASWFIRTQNVSGPNTPVHDDSLKSFHSSKSQFHFYDSEPYSIKFAINSNYHGKLETLILRPIEIKDCRPISFYYWWYQGFLKHRPDCLYRQHLLLCWACFKPLAILWQIPIHIYFISIYLDDKSGIVSKNFFQFSGPIG